MKEQVTIDRCDLIQLMAASGMLDAAPADELDAAWVRTWEALAPTPPDGVELHRQITKVQDVLARVKGGQA